VPSVGGPFGPNDNALAEVVRPPLEADRYPIDLALRQVKRCTTHNFGGGDGTVFKPLLGPETQ